jgi:hypothetical protein
MDNSLHELGHAYDSVRLLYYRKQIHSSKKKIKTWETKEI